MLSAFPESQARTIPQVSMLPFIGNNLSTSKMSLEAKEERKTDQQQDGKDRVGKSLAAA